MFSSGRRGTGGSRCIETAQCSAGYACVDGTCIQINSQPGNGTPTGFGLYKKGCYNNDGNCNSGRGSCSEGPTCGKGSGRVDCCGGRVRYIFAPGTESRITGDCIDNEYCHSFCTSGYALFGEVSPQCEGKPICTNTDCEECGLFSGVCEQKFGNLPCWCDGGAQCGACKACITNPNDSNFGQCARTSESKKRCRQCVSIKSHKCCGKEIGPVKKCAPPGFSGTTNDLRDALRKELQDRCSGACDECETKEFKTYCSNTTGLPDPSTLNCPDGLNCRQAGFLEIAGVQCVFVEEKDSSACSYKPGRWQFTGERNNLFFWQTFGHVETYSVSFVQGDPNNPNAPGVTTGCEDGGCYPAFNAPGESEKAKWEPVGRQEAWANEIVVDAIEGGCSGSTFGCDLVLYDSSGNPLRTLSPTRSSQLCNCWDSNNVENPEGNPNTSGNKGCYNRGVWEYIGPT